MMDLKVFTTKTCAYCPGVKQYLDRKNVKYSVIDASEDPKALEEAAKISGMFTVPQLMRGNKVVVGPNFGKISELISDLV